MKRMIIICILVFSFALSLSVVSAEDGFYVIATKKANYAPVQISGQTTSYTTGDDGDLQRGVSWPNPKFTDNGDGTVTDNLTGLIWLKDANCLFFNRGDIGWQNERSWNSALGAAKSLASGYCGLTDGSSAGDWRLPNIREFLSLIHWGYEYPALPNTAGPGKWTEGDPFSGVQSNRYWSSSTVPSSAQMAWQVFMAHGYLNANDKSNTNHVWPVRGGN